MNTDRHGLKSGKRESGNRKRRGWEDTNCTNYHEPKSASSRRFWSDFILIECAFWFVPSCQFLKFVSQFSPFRILCELVQFVSQSPTSPLSPLIGVYPCPSVVQLIVTSPPIVAIGVVAHGEISAVVRVIVPQELRPFWPHVERHFEADQRTGSLRAGPIPVW